MGRPPRILEPNILFHVIDRGNARNVIFNEARDFIEFQRLLKRFKDEHDITIYHYVLMTNHIHLLVEPKTYAGLPAFMQSLTIAHTRRLHKRNGTGGHIWEGRYKSIPIEADAYFLQCARYIELNPVRAGMVAHPSDYEWSSYRAHVLGVQDPIVEAHALLQSLGSNSIDRRNNYGDFVDEEIQSSKLGRARRFSEEKIYGDGAFVERFLAKQRIGV